MSLCKRSAGWAHSTIPGSSSLPELELPPAKTDYAENIYWVYGMVLSDGLDFDAAEMMSRLHEHGGGNAAIFLGDARATGLSEDGTVCR